MSLLCIIEKFSFYILLFPVPLFLLFYKQKIIKNIFIVLPSFILTLFIWLQNCNQFIWSKEFTNFKLIITPVVFFIFFLYFISFLYCIFDRNNHINTTRSHNNKKLFIIAFSIILISWFPAWLAEYPNSLSADAIAQFAQIFNIQPYANGNPLVHTLFLKILFSFFSLFTKDINLNIALISIISAIANIVVFSYASVYTYKRTNKLSIFIISLLFYSIVCHNVFYGIQISKDTMFSIFTILFIISLDRYFDQQSIKNTIALLVVSLFFSLLRHNGFYMIAGTVVFLIPFIKQSKFRKAELLLLIIFASSYIILNQIYPRVTKTINKDIQSQTVSTTKGIGISTKNIIPLQQISYIVYKDWSLTDKQKILIEKLAPLGTIRENYDMYFADPMLKTCEKYGDKSFYQVDKLEYYKLYFELFFKHPFDFIEAYCGMTNIYFYPFIREMNLYSNNMASNDFGFKKIRLVSEKYSNTVEEIYHSQFKIPILNLLLSPGVYTFFFIIAVFYFLYSKQYNKFILLIPIMTNILILITVVPINGEFRYYLPISACLPLVLTFILSKHSVTDKTIKIN